MTVSTALQKGPNTKKHKHRAIIKGSHMLFFIALAFAGSRGSCLNTRPLGRVFKHRPIDPASVNAMKQTCVIVILAYFTGDQHKQR